MEYREYDTLPLKIFAKILSDDSKKNLLGVGLSEQDKVWNKIRKEYNEKHPSDKEITLVEAYKKAQLSSIRLNKLAILLNLVHNNDDEARKLYSDAGIMFKESLEKRVTYLSVQVDKESQKLEIFRAQIAKLEEEIASVSQQEKKEVTLQEINDSMASLEASGIPVGDYDSVTCGRYDSLTKMISKKAGKK